jgi:hypothetical protein
MKLFLAFLILTCLGTAGCRRKRVEAPVPPPPAVEEVAPAPVAAPSANIPPPPQVTGPHPGEPANPAAVRTAYHQYFAKIGSFPNGWQDMVQKKFLPAVPQGKSGQPLDFVQFTLWEAGRPAR